VNECSVYVSMVLTRNFYRLFHSSSTISCSRSWVDNVARTIQTCSSVLFHLAPLVAYGTFYSNRDTVQVSLIVPQFLYCDVIFAKSSARLREQLKINFNACARYIYGISRFQHISEYTNRILGMPLDVYYDWRICCV
jgi:hypothetical protein